MPTIRQIVIRPDCVGREFHTLGKVLRDKLQIKGDVLKLVL